MAAPNEMSFFSRQVSMFRGVMRSLDQTFSAQDTSADSLTSASRALESVLANTTRNELRQEFSSLGNDLRNYQEMLRRYNVTNREDLERLVDVGRDLYDNEDQVNEMQNNFENALNGMGESQGSFMDNMRQNLTMMGVGDIQGNLDDEATSTTELSNRIKVASGLDKGEMQQLRQDLIGSLESINAEVGFSLVGYNDILENATQLAEELDIADPAIINKLAKDITVMQSASEASFDTTAKLLEKLDQRGFTDAQRMETMDSFVNVIENQMVDDDKVLNSLNTMSDMISTYSNGDADLAQEMNKSILKAATLFETNYLDSEPFLDTFKSAVLENDPEAMGKLTSQLGAAGLSVSDAQQSFQEGNFDEFSAQYIKSVGTMLKESEGANRAAIAEMYGIDSGEINKFIKSAGSATETLGTLSSDMENGKGAVSQAAEQTKLWHERLKNWVSGFEIFGTDVGTLVENLGANPLETFALFAILKDFGKGLAALTTFIWTRVLGGGAASAAAATTAAAGTAAATSATAAAGGAGAGAMSGAAGATGGAGAGVRSALGTAGKAFLPLGLAMGAVNIFTNEDKSEAVSQTVGGLAGGWAGAAGGAAAGAAIGSVIPIVGTAVGGIVGGVVGGLGGGLGGSWLGGKANEVVGGKEGTATPADAAEVLKDSGVSSSGVTGGIDIPSAEQIGVTVEGTEVPSYDVGTPYVPQDGLAYVHEGEAIIPADQNTRVALNSLDNAMLSTPASQMDNKLEERRRDAIVSKNEINNDTVVDAINTLTSFMKFWHQDELERSRRQERKVDPFAAQRQAVSSWEG